MKHIKKTKRIAILSFLIVFAASTLAGGIYGKSPTAYAAGDPSYVLYWPKDKAGTLIAEACGSNFTMKADGSNAGDCSDGIGDNDINGALGQTYIMTRGGRLGAVKIPLFPSDDIGTNNHDLPIYSTDYYCTPNNGYKLTTKKPSAKTTYVRLSLAIALMSDSHWGGLTVDKTYPTRIGFTGNSHIGDLHLPASNLSGEHTIKLSGQYGKNDVRYDFDLDSLVNHLDNDAGITKLAQLTNYVPSLKSEKNLKNATSHLINKCMIPHTSKNGHLSGKYKVTNFNKLSPSQQLAWRNAFHGDFTPPAGNGGGDGGSTNPECGSSNTALSWAICPVYNIVENAGNLLTGIIASLMVTKTHPIFGGCTGADTTSCKATSEGYKKAWSAMRNIALIIIVIVALIMIIAQAVGSQAVDAYTIKSVLPRLLVAAIFISLSWILMQFVVQFTNDLGYGIHSLIRAPFNGLHAESASTSAGIIINWGVLFAAVGAAGAAVVFMPGVLLFLALLVLFSLLIGFLVIVLRQILITLLIIVAPIAIACYALPNLQKAFSTWWDYFFKALLMFPIIIAFITLGQVFSLVALSQASGHGTEDALYHIIAIVAYIIPFFMLPMTFKMAGGAMGGIAEGVHAFGKRGGSMIKKAGLKHAQTRHALNMAGKTKAGAGRSGSLYRRAAFITRPNSGALSPTRKGRGRFAEMQRTELARAADESLKNDNGRWAGDDDASDLASQEGMTGDKFVEEYANRMVAKGMSGELAKKRAHNALGGIETSFDAKIGSDTMRVAAAKARFGSKTGFEGNANAWTERRKLAASMVRNGLMTTTDVAGAMKANQARADQSGVSFGELINYIDEAANNNGVALHSDEEMVEKSINGAMPGAIVGGHKSAITAAAPIMVKRLQEAADSGDVQEYNRRLAEIAGRYDVMAQVSPDSARAMADGVMGEKLNGMDDNIQQQIEAHRGNPEFVQMRREYSSSSMSQYQQYQQQQQQLGPPTIGPPTGPPAPGATT